MRRFKLLRASVPGLALMAAGWTSAADFTWLASPVNGNWNLTAANWAGAAGPVWMNGSSDNAVFGTSATTSVNVSAITASNLTFKAAGYSLSGGALRLFGNIDVTNATTALISSCITQVGTMRKLGLGTLIVDPGAAVENPLASLWMMQGTLRQLSGTNTVSASGSSPTAPALYVSGGTLMVGGGLLRTTGGGFVVVNNGGCLLVTNGVADFSGNQLLNAYGSSGTTTVGGNGVLTVGALRISHSQSSGGATGNVVNIESGGTLYLNNFYYDTNLWNGTCIGTVNFNGGKVVARAGTGAFLGDGSGRWATSIVARVLSGGLVISNDVNITIKQALLSGAANDGGLTKSGTAQMTLSGANTYAGVTTINRGNILLNCGSGESVLGSITINSYINSMVMLGASDQIADTSVLTFAARTTGRLQMLGFDDTLGGVQDSGGTGVRVLEAAGDGVGYKPGTLTLKVSGADSYNFGGFVRDAALTNTSPLSITKEGTGTQIFSGVPSLVNYSGATVINGGVLSFTGAGSVASNSAITLNGGNVMFGGGGTRSRAIVGTGGLIKAGANTLTFTGTNSFTGPTTVMAGTLAFGCSYALGGGDLSISNGATVSLNYAGTRQVASLTLGGVPMPGGTYGSADSPAGTPDTHFTGTGTVAVIGPPVILVNQQSQNATLGSGVSFAVAAAGTAPLTYQWRKNGTPIPGATGTTLSLSNVGFADNGNYDVVVSNFVGVVVSAPAQFLVTYMPAAVSANYSYDALGRLVGAEGTVDLDRVTYVYDGAHNLTYAYPAFEGPDLNGNGIPDAWEVRYFGSTGFVGMYTDCNNNGEYDFLDYAFGNNPSSSARPYGFRISVSAAGGSGFMYLTYQRNKNATQLKFTVLISDDLISWLPGDGYFEQTGAPVDNLDGTETVTLRPLFAFDAFSKLFARISVEAQ